MKPKFCYNCLHCKTIKAQPNRAQCTKGHWHRTYSIKYIQYDTSRKLLKLFINCKDYEGVDNGTT